MRFGGRPMLGSAQHQWRLRKKNNRTERRAARMRRYRAEKVEMSKELAMALHDDERSGSQSPCSVVTAFSVSVENRSSHREDSSWIRRTVVTDFSLMRQNRRSPLFTGRMLEGDESCRSNNTALTESQGYLGSNSCSARNREASKLSLRQRLGPPGSSSQDQQVDYWRNENYDRPFNKEDYSRDRYCGYTDENDDYDPEDFERDHQSSPTRRSHGYRQSLYYPPDCSNTGRDAGRSRALLVKTSAGYSERHADNSDYSERPNRNSRRFEEFNDDRFARDAFTPPPNMRSSYRQSLYYPPDYSSPRQNTPREPIFKGPWIDSQMNCPEYPPDFHEVPYNNERQSLWYDRPCTQRELYSSDMPSQRSLQFLPESSSTMRSATANSQQSRQWRVPQGNLCQYPPGQNMKTFFYQDR